MLVKLMNKGVSSPLTRSDDGNAIAPSNLDTSISEIETKITLNQLALSASLSTMDMDILRKKHIAGFTMRELATEYGKSEKAIESQLNRIITMLRAEAHKEDSLFADQPPFLSK